MQDFIITPRLTIERSWYWRANSATTRRREVAAARPARDPARVPTADEQPAPALEQPGRQASGTFFEGFDQFDTLQF